MNRCHSIWLLPVALLGLNGVLLGERVRLVEGTPIRVRLKADLIGDQAQPADRVDFEVAQRVVVRGLTVIPEGAVAWGAVQSAKKKEIKFDFAGIKLVNQTEIKLRSTAEKRKNPGKDVIRVDTKVGDTVVASKGSEFTAYVDEDADLDGTAAPVASPPSREPTPLTVSAPRAAPTPPRPTPVAVGPVKPAPEPAVITVSKPVSPPAPQMTRSSAGTPSSEAPAVSNPTRVALPPAPTTPAPAPVVSSPAPDQTARGPAATPATGSQELSAATERIIVECYSEPSGADILIDGNFVGNTPSILKVPVGSHQLEIQLRGYKTVRQPLELTAGRGISTIRVPLEKIQ